MKLVAQRVMQPGTKAQAIHTFSYAHGDFVWEGPPPETLGHGTLQTSHVLLTPLGNNHVLTYLDIIAPDETPTAQILQAFAKVYEQGAAPPFRPTVGNCTFESNMTHAFKLAWRQELVRLYEAALSARLTVVAV
jgi:hypothetical protein